MKAIVHVVVQVVGLVEVDVAEDGHSFSTTILAEPKVQAASMLMNGMSQPRTPEELKQAQDDSVAVSSVANLQVLKHVIKLAESYNTGTVEVPRGTNLMPMNGSEN